MPNRPTDALFQLIQSLERAEKRNFKLYATRNSNSGERKVVELFDALDKMKQYDENLLLKKHKSIQKKAIIQFESRLISRNISQLTFA